MQYHRYISSSVPSTWQALTESWENGAADQAQDTDRESGPKVQTGIQNSSC